MRSVLLVGSAGLMCWALGCGADDPPSGASNKAGASGSASTGGKAATGGDKATGGTTATAGGKATGGASPGAAGDGSNEAGADSSGALSPACQKYCDCHEQNCVTMPIPDGKSCAAFCMAMTAEQLTCRQNMCTLVPAQPNNNHCTHSLGINECL